MERGSKICSYSLLKKLKAFKDPELGIDFTNNNIKNLSEIINKVKEFEKENGYCNIMLLLSQKLSERNSKINNYNINKSKEEDVLVDNNKIIINNESIHKNVNNIEHKAFIVKNEEIKHLKINKINEKEKKIVKFCKSKNNKKIKLITNENENKNENIILNEEKEENKKEKKTKDEENYFEYDDNNKITFMGDYFTIENLNQFELETNNDLLLLFQNNLKEPNTITLINRNYFC